MKRTFKSKDVKKIINEIDKLRNKMQNIADLKMPLTREIREVTDQVLHEELKKTLETIPIEEINRTKEGIKVKILRDHGYETVLDVIQSSRKDIADINGIGEEMSRKIKTNAKSIATQVRNKVKIRINVDEKTDTTADLLLLLYIMMNHTKDINNCKTYLRLNNEKIDAAKRSLSISNRFITWLFASSRKKKRAINAYRWLSEELNSDFIKNIVHVEKSIKNAQNIKKRALWNDFSQNSIKYYNVLEKVMPGVLGNDDFEYGLPSELADEIQKEELYQNGLKVELRRYQELGVKYILHQEKVLLGDEMGLGKTVQAIATMVSLRSTGSTHFAVVCPASVITNWCREISKHSDLKVIKVHKEHREDAIKEWIENGGVAVTTYETTGYFEFQDNFKYDLLIVDEAHYIKNKTAKRSVNVRQMSEHANRLLFMTGTAIENKVDEMINLIEILQPEIAAELKGVEALSSAPLFKEKVSPVYYRRKKKDVLTELPDLIEKQEWCSLTPVEELMYEDAVLERNYAKSRRVSWHVNDLKNSSKATRLKEIVEAAAADDRRVIVFSFFLDTITKIKELFGDQCMPPITGSVSPQRRQQIIDEFDKSPAGTILVSQIQAGGTGLNVQSASIVVLCEPQFKPSIENQAIARAYRMGQTRNVFVHRLLCEDTVDERITDMLYNKQEIFDAFADDSIAAEENSEVDDKTFGNIIDMEIERIKTKRAEQEMEMVS